MNSAWKGDNVGYHGLHLWVAKYKEKTGECEHCGFQKETQWANIDGKYRRCLDDFIELCSPCHVAFDRGR